MNLNGFTLKFIRIYMAVRFDYYRFGVDMFCKHSMWSSTCTFLGRTPDPRHSSCVTIVTPMTLFWGYPIPYPGFSVISVICVILILRFS